MNKTKPHLSLLAISILGIALIFPRTAFASEEVEVYEAEVNGYHVSLGFIAEIKAGENEVHVQILDQEGLPVDSTEVEIMTMRMEEDAHGENESHGASETEQTSEHNNMPGMEMQPTYEPVEPSNGHDNMPGMNVETEPATESTHSMETDSHQGSTILLEHHMEDSEYKGVLNFDKSGEWNVVVHFTVGGELLEVDFPVTVVGAMSRYGVLAGIFGLNVAIISAAAIAKRKTAKKPSKGIDR